MYLIEILHQTTTFIQSSINKTSCILSKFYIKPQLGPPCLCSSCVVSYRNSTSNHNLFAITIPILKLYLIEILHQTTTLRREGDRQRQLYLIEILHQTTTLLSVIAFATWLYLIEILHQTTTVLPFVFTKRELYLIEILHQTTTPGGEPLEASRLYLIEILHQTTTLKAVPLTRSPGVSYRNSTSNHNSLDNLYKGGWVVSYRNSTSNHNFGV